MAGPLLRRVSSRLLNAGVSFARDEDDALRVRILNGCGWGALAVQTALMLLNLSNGDLFQIVRVIPLMSSLLVVLFLNGTGRLRAARWTAAILIPVVLLGLAGVGFARRGTMTVLPVVPLIPLLLFERPSARAWIPASASVAIAGGIATYWGLAHPIAPTLPPAQVPLVQGIMVTTATAVVTAMSWLMLWRRRRIARALAAALQASERASDAREAMLSTVSHELRTPSAMALALLEQLAVEPLPPRAQRLLGEAQSALGTEIDLLGDLLDVVSLRRSELALHERRFDLRQVVLRATSDGRARAEERSLGFELEVDESLIWRHGDPERLTQLLRHLVNNAVRFTQVGRVRVTARGIDDGAGVELSVDDTGCGMTEAELSRVFEAFEKVRAGGAREHPGLGVGLTLVRALVERMQGALRIESSPGQGCCCTVSLQLPEVEAEQVDEQCLAGRVVLVVDDLVVNRRILSRLVRKLGGEPVEAVDGAEAVHEWHSHTPDLVLMDMQMPVVDGLEATRRIRRAGGRTPIVAVTANATPEAEVSCLTAGMDSYLTKPVRPQDLLRAASRCGLGAPESEVRPA